MTCFGCGPRLTVRWTLSYAAINLDGADVQIREQKPQGLGRVEVTLQCDRVQWRVAYSFLHRVLDVDGSVHEVAELGAARVPGISR